MSRVPAPSPPRSVVLAAIVLTAGCRPAPPPPPPTQDPPDAPSPAAPPADATPTTPASGAPAAAPPPTPISGDLPDAANVTLDVHGECAKPDCRLDEVAAALSSVQAPGAVWSHAIAGAKSSLRIGFGGAVDLYGVVIGGRATIDGAGGDPLEAWDAFRAPGGDVTIRNAGPGDAKPSRLVLALATSGEPVGPLVDALVGAKGPGKRTAPIERVDLAERADLSWAGGAAHARIGFEGSGPRASLGLLLASPDTPVASHRHDSAWELLGVLIGRGTMRMAPAAGSEALDGTAVTPGRTIRIPAGVLHGFDPGRADPLFAVQLYVPPGPEQRFKKLDADAKAAPKP